jgi:hypothetical protein
MLHPARVLPASLLLSVCVLSFCPAARAQEIKPCKAKTVQERRHRGEVKHRARPDGVRARTLTVEEMFGWGLPAGVEDPDVRYSREVIDGREGRAFRLDALLWLVKVSDDYCDIHMELSGLAGNKKSFRVIAEIPNDEAYQPTWEKMLRKVAELKKAKRMSGKELKQPLRLRLTGLPFYDGAHARKDEFMVGHGHGSTLVATLWELHPVWDVVFVDD